MSPERHVSAATGAATAESARAPRADSPPALVLVTFACAGEPRAVRLERTITLGRDPACDVVLDEDAASRRHAVIDVGPTGIRIRDLDSRNGTFVNGRRVVAAPLRSGDVIRAGHNLLRLMAVTTEWQAADPAGPLVGGTALVATRRLITLVGPTPMPVFIAGETGTGKEVVARL